MTLIFDCILVAIGIGMIIQAYKDQCAKETAEDAETFKDD